MYLTIIYGKGVMSHFASTLLSFPYYLPNFFFPGGGGGLIFGELEVKHLGPTKYHAISSP